MEMRAVYAESMAALMENDHHVCILDADLSKASGTRGLYERFPKQMFDCGVAEQNMASVAAGLASYGFKPYIESFTPFATRRICVQVTISIAYAGMNVKIVGTDPGIWTGRVLTVENHNVIGGLHSAVLEALAEERIPVHAVGVPDRFGEVGKMPYLREVMGFTKENIINKVKEILA